MGHDNGTDAGLSPTMARGPKEDVLVLCYHALSDAWESELAVSPAALVRQLEDLMRRGYEPVTFTRAVTDPPHGRVVAVTFDDAYRSVHQLGLPALERLGVPATVFAPTAFVGSERPMRWAGIDHWDASVHRAELGCMSWEQLRELATSGWEVGSHTRSHPRLPELGDEELTTELRESKEELEAGLGLPCTSLAYPYGACDERVVAAAQRTGYRAAASLTRLPHAPEPLRWPRVGVYPENPHWLFRAKVSPPLRRLAIALG
jgi:peptidoglycan/xylan/chitin deacetylase (PgdA/CDA1 family)